MGVDGWGSTILFLKYCYATPQTKTIPSEGDNLLLSDDVLEIDLGSVEGHVLDGLGCLSRVLEVNSVKTIFNLTCLSVYLVGRSDHNL